MKSHLTAVLWGAIAVLMSAATATAGHAFTQGTTNTPVWLQAGQGVFVEQFYSYEYDEDAGYITDIGFDYADVLPDGAPTDSTEWYEFGTGDVIKISIGDSWSISLAYDANENCEYSVCGWDDDDLYPADYSQLAPDYSGWGTVMPDIAGFDTNSDSSLSLAEVQAASRSELGSLAAFLTTDVGLTAYQYGTPVVLDTSSDSLISEAELTAFNSSTYNDNPITRTLAASFATYDTDNSSDLSQAEIDAAAFPGQFTVIDGNSDGVITDAEMLTYVWQNSGSMFQANSDGTEGVLNDFGITFEAVAGEFSLDSYRIADAAGLNLHGSGSGPVDQTSVCIPPNCGANAGVTAVGTQAALAVQATVERQAMERGEQLLVGASLRDIDVNFDSVIEVSQGGGHQYRWATAVEGSYARNSEVGSNAAGSLIVAYALDDELDLGVFAATETVNLSLLDNGYHSNMQAVGMYLRGRANSREGFQWRASAGILDGSARMSRAATDAGGEAATGTASISGYMAAVEIATAFRTSDAFVTPYARLTYAETSRAAYTESDGASAPVSYDKLVLRSTIARVGVNANVMLRGTTTMVGDVYAESDFGANGSGLSGTSTIDGLSEFDLAATAKTNDMRFGSSIAIYEDISASSRVYSKISVSRETYGTKPTVGIALGFETRF
ncbi:autotransporter outer membrane beta-barrel domain-containing protein [Celeribacter marinus]|uniref:autotransporter outer membrane beta-barrel domain-containing protein n=1 Tax=Celeribacter marinus TaxID=1397108 RepID=UPI003F6CFDE4